MRRIATLVALLAGGCSIISPPPLVPAHQVAQPKPKGTTTISLVGGLGGGVWLDGALGLGLRVSHQTGDQLELGVGVGIGKNQSSRDEKLAEKEQQYQECLSKESAYSLNNCSRDDDVPFAPEKLLAVRVFGTYNPDLDHPWYAITFGAGAGLTDNGIRYLTLDTGARVSSGDGDIDAIFGVPIALSIPVRRGRPIENDERPRTTWFIGGLFGLMGNADGRYNGGVELGVLHAGSPDDEASVMWLTAGGSIDVREPDSAP